jgi:DNA mismatch repair ATPase MutS
VLEVVNARHPTVEYSLMTSSSSPRPFIPNDLNIDPATAPVHIITGPNMGGKSTVLRLAAILVILAQSGSFVPADSATLGVVDAVFSRVGARDDLYRDMSTFMLEMHEWVLRV